MTSPYSSTPAPKLSNQASLRRGGRRVEQAMSVDYDGTLSPREATTGDFDAWFALFDAVAGEQKWIGREGPLDRGSAREGFDRYLVSEDTTTLLVEAQGELVGLLGIEIRTGLAEIWMMVDSA